MGITESSANEWGELMYGPTMNRLIGSNYMMIRKTKYIEDLMRIYISFQLRYGRWGGFTINTTKRCLLRLIELQPVECHFQLLVESSFFLHTPSAQESSVVFETALLCRYSRSSTSSSQILGSDLFYRIINRLHDANEPFVKDIFRLCPDLPIQKKPCYLEFCEMHVFCVVRLYCQHIF